MLVRLATWCYERRRLVVALWVAALVAAIAASAAFGGAYKADYFAPGSDSKAALDLLREKFPQRSGDTIQVVFRAPGGVDRSPAKDAITALLDDMRDEPHVVGVVGPFDPRGAFQVSKDRTIAYADVDLDMQGQDFTLAEAKALTGKVRAADGKSGVQVEAGGQVPEVASQGQVGSEGIGFLAAALILLVTFGSLVAMGLPLMTAVFGIGIALSLGAVMRHVVSVPNWAPQVAAMVGIGVGIDYAIYIMDRIREEYAESNDLTEAVVRALSTTGLAVAFTAATLVAGVIMWVVMSDLRFQSDAAMLLSVMLVLNAVAAMVLVPSWVLVFKPRFITGARRDEDGVLQTA